MSLVTIKISIQQVLFCTFFIARENSATVMVEKELDLTDQISDGELRSKIILLFCATLSATCKSVRE